MCIYTNKLGDCLVTDSAAAPHVCLIFIGIFSNKHALHQPFQTCVLRATDASDIFSQLLLVLPQVLVIVQYVQDGLFPFPRFKQSACAPYSLKTQELLKLCNTN